MSPLDLLWLLFILSSLQPLVQQRILTIRRVQALRALESATAFGRTLIHRREGFAILGSPLRAQYDLSEAQLRVALARAVRSGGSTGEALLVDLETRLDALVLRAGFSRTIYQARQAVSHGHVTVNGRRVDRPSFHVRTGDVIEVAAASRTKTPFVIAATRDPDRLRRAARGRVLLPLTLRFASLGSWQVSASGAPTVGSAVAGCGSRGRDPGDWAWPRCGVLLLIYETPGGGQADVVAKTVTAALAEHGFATTVTTASVPSLVCITARPSEESWPGANPRTAR